MGTQYITAGYGDRDTFPAGVNDPQDFDADAAIQAEDAAEADILNSIKPKEAYDARFELAGAMLQTIDNFILEDLIDAFLNDPNRLTECVADMIDEGVKSLAIKRSSH